MSKNYYVLSNGRVKREQNTLFIEGADGVKRPVPIEDVDSLYLYGEVDLNTKLLVFLSQKKIPLHVFNYYGFYSGSYYPRESLNSGYLLVHQVSHYSDPAKRLRLARELVKASAHSLLRNIAYYAHRRGTTTDPPAGEIAPPESLPLSASERVARNEPGEVPSGEVLIDPDAEAAVDAALTAPPESLSLSASERVARNEPGEVIIDPDAEAAVDAALTAPPESLPLSASERVARNEPGEVPSGEVPNTESTPLAALQATIEGLAAQIDAQPDISSLMGIEGKMRERYYQAWRHILTGDWLFERRVRRPPDNEVNALISFGNSMLYTVCLAEIYRTQLTPTISYLHEPGVRRFSLALDISEIFKPLIVDRAIFRLINAGQLTPAHFDSSLNGCYLNDSGRKLFLQSLEDRLKTTIKHRRLGRSVSYRHLIRLECYKLIRHLTDVEPYHAFRAWW